MAAGHTGPLRASVNKVSLELSQVLPGCVVDATFTPQGRAE